MKHIKASEQGYSLMEVLIALVFIGLMSTGLMIYSRIGQKVNILSDRISNATMALEQTLEQLRVQAQSGLLTGNGVVTDTVQLPRYVHKVSGSWSPWGGDPSLKLVEVKVTVFWKTTQGLADSLTVNTLFANLSSL